MVITKSLEGQGEMGERLNVFCSIEPRTQVGELAPLYTCQGVITDVPLLLLHPAFPIGYLR